MTSCITSLARVILACALLAAGASGCAVKSVYVKPDFAKVDKFNLKRIAVVATPLKSAPEVAAKLLARIARRYVLQHKDWLALREGVLAKPDDWKSECKDKARGVLRVMVRTLREDKSDLFVDAVADLRRCDTGALIWRVEIRDTNEKKDDDLSKLAAVYKDEFGDTAKKYAAPFFVVVKTAFDSLPSPKLTEAETMEKIELE
ncbi:MAG: MXAN_6521/LA_1396 family lipoprotein [Myxococcales bacterium]|nr:MXAN_6521/LA_1396 family lipoprotein [Myxococcales bacterium]